MANLIPNRLKSYLKLVFAKSFSQLDGKTFIYTLSKTEKFGNTLLKPFSLPLDLFLRILNWQVILIGLTIASAIGTTFFYYPDQIAMVIEWVVPLFSREQVKFFSFMVLQVYLNGLFLRFLGRLSNKLLINAWTTNTIKPFLPG